MSIQELRRLFVARIMDGEGQAPAAQRRAAFDRIGLDGALGVLIEKVATAPTGVTDADIAAVCAAGLGEDQVFELMVCPAVGQADRQYEAAVNALAAATAKA